MAGFSIGSILTTIPGLAAIALDAALAGIKRIPAEQIQGQIDEQLARVQGLDQVVEYVRYCPEQAAIPGDATHVLELNSRRASVGAVLAIKLR